MLEISAIKYRTFNDVFFLFSWTKQVQNKSFYTKKLINLKVEKGREDGKEERPCLLYTVELRF